MTHTVGGTARPRCQLGCRPMRRGGTGVVIGGVGRPSSSPAASSGTAGPTWSTASEFVEQCSPCHMLARAGAPGVVGPNLDDAFRQSGRTAWARTRSTASSISRSSSRTTTRRSTRLSQDPSRRYAGRSSSTGDDARDVGRLRRPGRRRTRRGHGRLAGVGASKAEGTAKAENGTLDIPVAESGLAYKFADAEARPARSRSPPRTRRPSSTTSRSRATASTRRANRRSGGVSEFTRRPASPASTRSSAPWRATARAAWKAG